MIGGGVGLMGAMGALKRSDLLKRAALTHKVKRGTMINTIVGRVRDRSGQFGSFGKFFFNYFVEKLEQSNTGFLSYNDSTKGYVITLKFNCL